MKIIDPKHHIEGERIIKTGNLEPIPDNEPLLLLRGRDRLALPLLKHYLELSIADGCTAYHMDAVNERIKAFQDFALSSPTMKQPGITKGK